MKDVEWMDKLKLRLSYGESGNLAGSSYQYMSDYGSERCKLWRCTYDGYVGELAGEPEHYLGES